MTDNKLGLSDFEAEVQRLKTAGKFPSLDEILDAVAETRKRFAAKILEARQSPNLDQGAHKGK